MSSSSTVQPTAKKVLAESLGDTISPTAGRLMALGGEYLMGLSLGILERLRKDENNPPDPPPNYGPHEGMIDSFIDALAGVDIYNMCGGGNMKGGASQDMDANVQQALIAGQGSGNLVRQMAKHVQTMISASATLAAQAADDAAGEAKAAIEELTGLSGMTWAEAMPKITDMLMATGVLIKRMADDPKARAALQSFAVAIGDTGMELVRVTEPEVVRVTNKIGQSMGTVGGIAARRAAMAAVSVFKAGISMIPGVNVVAFGIMTIMSIITGALRITLQAVGTGEETVSSFMNSAYSMGQVLEDGSKAVASATQDMLEVADQKVTPKEMRAASKKTSKEAEAVEAVPRRPAQTGGRPTRKTKHGNTRAKTIRRRVQTSIDRFLRRK